MWVQVRGSCGGSTSSGLELQGPHTCCCGATADALGQHSFVCKQAPSRIARHPAPERPGDPCLGISRRPCHKVTSRSYTQRRQTPGRNDSDSLAFWKALGLECDSRQHHNRVLRRCCSLRMRRGGGNGCHQEMSEVLWAVHGIPVPSNCRGDSEPSEWLGIWVLQNSRSQNNWRVWR